MMAKEKIPKIIFEKIEEANDRYRLFNPNERIIVAYSGGKDSTLLSLTLKQLGYDIHLLAIDMGYSQGWGNKICAGALELGFENIELVNGQYFSTQYVPNEAKERITNHLNILNSLSSDLSSITPCTHCYNIKVANMLTKSIQLGGHSIAFGHHATDAMASFLKSVIMHIDRWERRNEIFSYEDFSKLVDDISNNILVDHGAYIIKYSKNLISLSQSGTDEPPHQTLSIKGIGSVPIIRPLFLIFENDVEIVTHNIACQFEGSGCGHGITSNSQTPREMIHWRILRKLDQSPLGRNIRSSIFELMLQTIDVSGYAKVNVRNNRDQILGRSYKGNGELTKKL